MKPRKASRISKKTKKTKNNENWAMEWEILKTERDSREKTDKYVGKSPKGGKRREFLKANMQAVLYVRLDL